MLGHWQEEVTNVASALELYTDKLEQFNFSGVNPSEYDLVSQGVKALSELKLPKPTTLNSAVMAWSALSRSSRLVGDILAIYNKYDVATDFMSSSISSDLVIERTRETLSLANVRGQAFQDHWAAGSRLLALDLLSPLKVTFNDVEKIAPSIDNIGIWSILAKQFISEPEVQIRLECIKDELMTGAAPRKKAPNVVQARIQTSRLVPTSISKPLKDILKMLDPSASSLEKLCRIKTDVYKFGYIVIHNLLKRPLEMNPWALRDSVNVNMGVNKKILERFTTIVPLLDCAKKDKIVVWRDLFGPDRNLNFFYILETLDGLNYRILYSNFHLEGHPYAVPFALVDSIDDHSKTPSRRIESLNQLIEEQILAHVGPPIISVAKSEEAAQRRRNEFKWDSFRRKVLGLMVQSAVDSGKSPKEYLVSKNARQDLSNSILVLLAGERGALLEKMTPEARREIQLAYQSDLNKLLNNFRLLAEDIAQKEKIKLEPALEEILGAVINKRRDNIYQLMIHKAEIVSKTFDI